MKNNNKETIVKNLKKHRKMLDDIIYAFEHLDGDGSDPSYTRRVTTHITFSLFSFIDDVHSTEIMIYNFFKDRSSKK